MIMKSPVRAPTGARVLFMIMASSRQIAPVSGGHDHETDRRERARKGGSGDGEAERAPGWERSGGGGVFGADGGVVGLELAGAVFDLGAHSSVAAGGFLDFGGVGSLLVHGDDRG